MELAAVAAVSDNLAIGKDGAIPWESIPEDRQQYRARIADDPVILGRRTFDSMRDDLPGRAQIVLTRSERSATVETAYYVSEVEKAIQLAAGFNPETAYVIGGEAIYRLFQPHIDRMFLSRVPGEYEGDTYYPEWDEAEWKLVEETPYDRYTLEEWARTE